MNALTVPNGVAVALFGIALSAAFCDIHWTKKNCIILAVGSAAMLLMQALITYKGSWMAIQEAYPLTTHLPLAIILSVLSGKWLWPTISVLAAYLCCQLRRWVALLVIAMVPGIDWLQPAVEMVVTLPLLAILLRYVAPAARSFARYPRSMQLLFGVVPLAGYLFDYVTRIYTDLLAQGNQAAVEFMPFVCSVAQKNYLYHSLHIPPQVFIIRYTASFSNVDSGYFSRISTLFSITFQQNGVVMVYQTVLYQPDIFRSCRSDDPGKSTSFAICSAAWS